MLAETPRPKIKDLPKIEVSDFSHLPPALALSKETHARVHTEMLQAFPLFVPKRAPLPSSILDALQRITSKLTKSCYRGNIDLLKQIIFDANTLAFNPPCATDDSQKLAFFASRTYLDILETILKEGSVEQSDLEYLHTHEYLELNTPQRFFLLSLYSLKKSVRTGFLGSDNGQKLLKHSGLAYWLTNSPYIHFQQTRLNTCIATVFSQECLTHAPTVAALYPICKKLLKRLHILLNQAEDTHLQKPAWKGGPSIESLLKKRLDKIQSMLGSWRDELSSALRTPASRLDFGKVAAGGHACLELILSCSNIAAPNWGEDKETLLTLNTPYILPGKWQISRALLFIRQGWQRLLGKKIPTLKERYHQGYVSYDGCKKLLNDTIKLPAAKEESYLVFPAGKRPSEEALLHLWEHVAHMGSARLERPGHAALLRTHFHKKTPLFILDDPMAKNAQALSFKELGDLFTAQEIILFLEVTQEEEPTE